MSGHCNSAITRDSFGHSKCTLSIFGLFFMGSQSLTSVDNDRLVKGVTKLLVSTVNGIFYQELVRYMTLLFTIISTLDSLIVASN